MGKLENLEQLILEARSVNSCEFEVEEDFKEDLREKLYNHYLNSQNIGIMAKLKSITLNWKVMLASLGVLLLVAFVAGGGAYLLTRNKSEESESVVLLAANLAVADGDVEIKRGDDDRWMEGKQGDVLNESDSIRTDAESRAVLELDNGDAVRLNASSEVRLESMDPTAVVMDQVSGESYSRVASSETNTYTIKGQGVEAQAMGTAYTFSTDEEKKQVVVSVYESRVQLNVEEKEVAELNKAVVNTEKNEVKVEEMSEEDFNKEFAEWNKEKDKEADVECYEETGPEVTITEPADGTEVESSVTSIAVKGTVTDSESALRKIKVNGTVYTSKDENGKGFNPSDGTFDVDVALNEGDNVITIVAYDIYWNAGEDVSITVKRKVNETPTPENYFYVASASSPAAGKISVTWAMSGYSAPKGFKAVAAVGKMPVYPGDKYAYKSEPGAREATITGLPAGTYNVRVCIYTGSGCSSYTTNYKVVEVSGESSGVNSISLSGTGANVSWSVDGYSSQGFKVVWSKTSGPTYPCRGTDQYHYLSDSNAKSDTLSAFDGAGTYYVRVCEYLGGKCGVYSNQITVNL
jgi:hypothetical protein